MQSIMNQFRPADFLLTVISLALLAVQTESLMAQQPAAPKVNSNPPIEIPETPKAIDPSKMFPEALTKKVSVTFKGEPLKKVIEWISREAQIYVIVDYVALANVKLLETEPIFEKLDDAPIYMLLSRLEAIGLGWYMEGKALMFTSRDEAIKHQIKVAYQLTDLLDAGYTPTQLQRLITTFTNNYTLSQSPNNDAVTAPIIGDMAFVRHREGIHREVAGLLAALRQHGRRTFIFDSPQNDVLRQGFDKIVTVDFQETPLIVAVEEISQQSGIPMRLDRIGLGTTTIRDRSPVTTKLKDQKLSLVLRTMFTKMGLGWYLQDDVLWITAKTSADLVRKTAVFDVRDLCSDKDESDALKEALVAQAQANWTMASAQSGLINIPKPGVLVARHTEAALDELLELLESYRAALRVSKVRTFGPPAPDSGEVVTGYYRLPQPMAADLKTIIPKLIQPESWKTEAAPQAVGEILEIASDAKGGIRTASSDKSESKELYSENAVLMIKQTRAVHQKIGKLINSLNGSAIIDREATIDTSQKPKPSINFGSNLRPAVAK